MLNCDLGIAEIARFGSSIYAPKRARDADLLATTRREGGLIYSYVTIRVEGVEKAAAGLSAARIVVRQVGGVVGNVGMLRSSQPVFSVNERVKVYLKKEGAYFRVVGGSLGKEPLTEKLIFKRCGVGLESGLILNLHFLTVRDSSILFPENRF